MMTNASFNAKEALQENKIATSPFKIIHVNHFGPLPEMVDGYKHIFIIIDSYTRYT